MKMSRSLAVALINCDPSGLDDETLEVYNNINFHFVVIDWVEESSDINGVCEFTKLHDHCVQIEEL